MPLYPVHVHFPRQWLYRQETIVSYAPLLGATFGRWLPHIELVRDEAAA
jgi:hypothetical protein